MPLRSRLVALASLCAVASLCACPSLAFADGPGDNKPAEVRRIPKLGIEVPPAVKQQLTAELALLEQEIQNLARRRDARTPELLPDIQIYWQAVHDALTYQEFYVEGDLKAAAELLAEGRARAASLLKGEAPWTTATGLVVRGYVSQLDGSVQPYGLVIPESYTAEGKDKLRLDFWFHGRGETLSEVSFLQQRRKQPGVFTPANTIVLHPYGRYCNANKLAGEVDAFEALESVRRRYRIDDDRIAVRGFSMGGASVWHLAVHYPTRWAAANPGAGFSETPDFLKVFQKEETKPTWYEQTLWHMYDCTDWATNLHQCPTVAYSGELDPQKQAADIMAAAMQKAGLTLTHVIGAKTKHQYSPEARADVDAQIAAIVAKGRVRVHPEIRFVTYTLRYNECGWITIDGLAEHWKQARIHGKLAGPSRIELSTENITALSLRFPTGDAPFAADSPVQIVIDGTELRASPPTVDKRFEASLVYADGAWKTGAATASGLRKRHLQQGPIDDAFLSAFLFVKPSGTSKSPKVDAWTKSECDRAIEHWRRHFRGHPRVKLDTEVTAADIAGMNLILFGDASSNTLIAKLAGKLPIQERSGVLHVGGQTFPADHHAPILIYPNPLNPERYVVLNSSFTFREFAYLNNARQVPKLPDWAIVDLDTPADALWPGKIVAADFFDERWELKQPRE